MDRADRAKTIEMIDENVGKIDELVNQKIDIWFEHVLYSDLWWMGVAFSVIPWIIWIIIRKRDSTDRLLFVGFYVMVISVISDIMGDQLGLWHYRFNVIPFLPTYFPWDTTLMPLCIITLIQFKPKLNPWYKAIFFALTTSYVAEPFFKWLTVYQLIHWRYSYSVPIQFAIYMSAHWLSQRKQFAKIKES
jgi:hypothetical protein